MISPNFRHSGREDELTIELISTKFSVRLCEAVARNYDFVGQTLQSFDK